MATASYMTGRKKYARPQAMLWADNPGTVTETGLYVPQGLEIGADPATETDPEVLDQFLILSDNNRGNIQMTPTRIEKRERMVNGRMRSHHIADKMTLSTSWNMLPSRSYASYPDFNQATGKSDKYNNRSTEFTTDGGAGGAEMLDWYNNHPGSFWVYLAYDNYKNFSSDEYGRLGQYNEVIEVFFSDFSYNIVKRGNSTHDFWDISVALEEV